MKAVDVVKEAEEMKTAKEAKALQKSRGRATGTKAAPKAVNKRKGNDRDDGAGGGMLQAGPSSQLAF